MFKLIKQILLGLFILILVVPYLIPTDSKIEMPAQPYENSAFYTTSDHVSLHYRVWSNEDNLGKILLIHGLGSSTFSYRYNAQAYADAGYTVVAVDLPAFGFSDRSTEVSSAQVDRARYLWELLDQLDQNMGDDPWHLVGHSMGGSTVLAMVNQNPTHVKTMTLIDPGITSDNPKVGWLLSSPLGEWLKVALTYGLLTEDSFASTLESAYQKVPTQADIQGYLEPLLLQGSADAFVSFVQSSDNVLIDELIDQDIPLHLMWGSKDTWINPDQIEVIQASVTVNVLDMFENAGHCPHETDPSFNSKFLEFIQLY